MIKYLSITLLCIPSQLHTAELDTSKKLKTYEVTQAEFDEHRTPHALLLRGIYDEDVNMFTQALTNGAHPNTCYGPKKEPALSIAAQRTSTLFVQCLINFNAEVNARNVESHTPLMAACARGNGAITELLLSRNADTSLVDDAQHDALTHAVYFRNLSSFKHLIAYGCDLNSKVEKEQSTPLMVASHWGYADIMCALLSFGADPFINDNLGQTVLDHAQRSRQRDTKDKKKELKFKQAIKVLEDYMTYSREIYKAAAGPLGRIVASYLVCKCPEGTKISR